MAATTYYNHSLIAHVANIAHDPYFLEGACGDDLEKLKGMIEIGGNDITGFTTETSEEDFRLSIAGIRFGETMWRYGWTGLIKPGNWIRNNIATEN